MKRVITGVIMLGLLLVPTGCGSSLVDSKRMPQKAKPAAETAKAPEAQPAADSVDSYFQYIGMTEDQLTAALKETPVPIDEGGLEYAKKGIRVWFDGSDSTKVNQILFSRNSVDFHGVKAGEPIDAFKKLYGPPLQEDTTSAYANFTFQGLVLSVCYDPKTKQSAAVYLVKEWH